MHPETTVIRAGRTDQPDSLAPPMFFSTNYVSQSLKQSRAKAGDLGEPRFYSRHSNPTVAAFEEAVAELEGAEAARAFSSGMGAISSVVFALCSAGDHIVVQRQLYGASWMFFQWIRRFGLELSYADAGRPGAFAEAVQPGRTKLVFAEIPSNPLMGLADLGQLGDIAGPVVAVDSTAAPPTVQQPLSWGVDLSLHSATKSIAGHNDAMLGVVSGSRDLVDWIRGYSVLHGASASPYDAMSALRGLRTLSVRVARQSQTAQQLAAHLERHPAVARVWFLGLESHPDYELGRRQMKQPGGVLAFELADQPTAQPANQPANHPTDQPANPARDPDCRAALFLERLQLAQLATSMGGPETLVTHPRSTTHAGLLPEELEAVGISSNLLRVSVGLEHPDDLLADFDQALKAVLL